MADIVASDILVDQKASKKATKGVSSKTPEQKEGASLFDKLLKNATKQDSTSTDTTNDLKNQTKTTQTSDNKKETTVKNPEVVDVKKDVQTKATPKQSSLFDRIVQDYNKSETSKKDPKEVETLQKKSITRSTLNVDNKVEDKTTQDDAPVKESKKDKINTSNQAKSMMDRLVEKNTNENVETNVEKKATNTTLKTTEKNIQENISEDNKLDITKNESKNNNQNITKTEELKQKQEKTSSVVEIKTQTTKEEKSTPTSLMDKMVQQIKDTQVAVKNETLLSDETALVSEEKISKETILESKITKEINQNETKETSSKTSMLDRMLSSIENNENQTQKVDVNTKNVSKEVAVEQVDQKQLMQANRYLQDQTKSKNLIKEQAKHDAKEVLVENKTQIKAEDKIQKSAKILELNPSKVEVEEINSDEVVKVEQTKLDEYVFKKSYSALNRAYLNEDTVAQKTSLEQTKETKESKESQNEKLDTKSDIKNIELKVDRTSLEVFTTKVIAAKQKTETFMSDLARQMYQNYKPPITAFRINLNPANLGSIAIMIKSNKSENSLSVSMNMSQVNTFETMSDNKSSLQSAIAKNFTEDSQISLDLNFSDNNNGEFEAMYQEEQKRLVLENEEDLEEPQSVTTLSQSNNYM